jgi:hypothetical protein
LVSRALLKRQGDYASLRVTLNTRLAETFTARVELMSDPEALMARREDYGCEVPDPVRVIVAGVDTQASWLEWLICGIASQSELFLLDRGQIDGRIESDAERIYSELDTQVLNRRWHRSAERDEYAEYFSESAAITCRVLYRTEQLTFVQFRTEDWPGYRDFSNYARVALFPEHVRPADPQSQERPGTDRPGESRWKRCRARSPIFFGERGNVLKKIAVWPIQSKPNRE